MEDKLFAQGQAALRAGDKVKARQIFQTVIQQDPQNENAWLWLVGAMDNDYERMLCLEKALKINPDNADARKALDRIKAAITKATQPPAVVSSTPPFVEQVPTQSMPSPSQPIYSPPQPVQGKSCPSCRKNVPVDALMCPYCGKHFFEEIVTPVKPTQPIKFGSVNLIAAGIGLIIGAILPWGSVTSVLGRASIYGYEGDGLITGGVGIALLLAGIFRLRNRSIMVGILAIMLNVLVIYITRQKYIDISNIEGNEYVAITTGTGLYLNFFSAFLGFIGGLSKTIGQ